LSSHHALLNRSFSPPPCVVMRRTQVESSEYIRGASEI
jgi:hypothetical protein